MKTSGLCATHHFLDLSLGGGFRGMRKSARIGCMSQSAAKVSQQLREYRNSTDRVNQATKRELTWRSLCHLNRRDATRPQIALQNGKHSNWVIGQVEKHIKAHKVTWRQIPRARPLLCNHTWRLGSRRKRWPPGPSNTECRWTCFSSLLSDLAERSRRSPLERGNDGKT